MNIDNRSACLVDSEVVRGLYLAPRDLVEVRVLVAERVAVLAEEPVRVELRVAVDVRDAEVVAVPVAVRVGATREADAVAVRVCDALRVDVPVAVAERVPEVVAVAERVGVRGATVRVPVDEPVEVAVLEPVAELVDERDGATIRVAEDVRLFVAVRLDVAVRVDVRLAVDVREGAVEYEDVGDADETATRAREMAVAGRFAPSAMLRRALATAGVIELEPRSVCICRTAARMSSCERMPPSSSSR